MRSTTIAKSVAAARKTASTAKSQLQNGLTVVSKDNHGPISQLVLAFRAGARYQSPKEEGLIHHIRNFVGRDVQSYPGLQLVWSAAASGGRLNAFSTRDVFGVQLNVPRDQAAYALSILGHVAGKPAFKPWELEDVTPTMLADLSYKNAFDVVVEDIHRAAFRNGPLGNSIYASKHQIGKISCDTMSNFASKHFVSGNGVLLGYNVDMETIRLYGDESGAIDNGSAVNVAESAFKGGEFRRQSSSKYAHIIIAGSGASGNNTKDVATQAVLAALIGKASPLQFTSTSIKGSALGQLPGSPSASSFQAVYENAGLVGAYIVADADKASEAVKSAVSAMKNIKTDNIEDAKRRASNDILFSQASTTASIAEACSVLTKGPSAAEVISAIKDLTANDVQTFAKKAFAKISMASYGSINNVPYIDEL